MSKTFDFGAAIVALKDGKRVTRSGWNGKGMFLIFVGGWIVPPEFMPRDGSGVAFLSHLPHESFIAMKTADNKIVPWLASQTDMLATDWMVSG